HNIASCTGRAGDATEAVRLFRELLPDQERVLGRDHHDTLMTRGDFAFWTRTMGDAREALRLFRELLSDFERVLERDHPDTLTAMRVVGISSIENGERQEGCQILQDGLRRGAMRFGEEHSLVREIRDAIDECGCPNA